MFGTASTTYLYDVNNDRVRKESGATTTYYVGKLYERNVATTTKNIYLDDILIATVDGNGTATTTNHIHSDHLGSTRLVSDPLTDVLQVADYYPYGSLRVDESYGGQDVSKKFIGQDYDEESEMSYLNARYYEGSSGQFLS